MTTTTVAMSTTSALLVSAEQCPCAVIIENVGDTQFFASFQGNDVAGIPMNAGAPLILKTLIPIYGRTASGTSSARVTFTNLNQPLS